MESIGLRVKSDATRCDVIAVLFALMALSQRRVILGDAKHSLVPSSVPLHLSGTAFLLHRVSPILGLKHLVDELSESLVLLILHRIVILDPKGCHCIA